MSKGTVSLAVLTSVMKPKRAVESMNRRISYAEAIRSTPGRGRVTQRRISDTTHWLIHGRLILASFGRHSFPDEEKRLPCPSRER
jgi:hypothetical protein